MGSLFSKIFSKSKRYTKTPEALEPPLDYEKLIILDAENLAEQGIAESYRQLLPELARYISHPAALTEVVDGSIPDP